MITKTEQKTTYLLKGGHPHKILNSLKGKTILVCHLDNSSWHYFKVTHEEVIKALSFYHAIELELIEESDWFIRTMIEEPI